MTADRPQISPARILTLKLGGLIDFFLTMTSSSTSQLNLNFYEVLEISSTATPEEIKKSFQRLIKLEHPDKSDR